MNVAIIDYGAGNVQSLKFALERLGYSRVTLTSLAGEIQQADKVIFPGVGHALAARKALEDKGLIEVIPALTQPVLGICLGMQLMFAHSEEGNVPGLGIFEGKVKRFNIPLAVPHTGWNSLENTKGNLFENVPVNSYVYFVHSYFAPVNKATTAVTNYGLQFAAAAQDDNFFGCQFHPEKSGEIGSLILSNFLSL